QSPLIALNYGSKYGDAAGSWAGSATAPDGSSVQTPTNPHVLISLMVERDTSGHCFVADPEPPLCDETKNKSLDLSGNTNLFLAGVQYAPTDHASVSGGTDNNGDIGEVISWTLKYFGNSTL